MPRGVTDRFHEDHRVRCLRVRPQGPRKRGVRLVAVDRCVGESLTRRDSKEANVRSDVQHRSERARQRAKSVAIGKEHLEERHPNPMLIRKLRRVPLSPDADSRRQRKTLRAPKQHPKL